MVPDISLIRIWLSVGAVSLKYFSSLSFSQISLTKKHLFEIKHTDFLYSCIFPLPYTVISETGISFSGFKQYSCFTDFHFLIYRFHRNIDYLL